MHFEESFWIKVLRVQTVCLLPHLLQLVFTALHKQSDHSSSV